jgi:transglutaminase-like putative cysteine protease
MVLDATCRIHFVAEKDVPAIMMLRPRSGEAQWITREEYVFSPDVPVLEYTDKFGNLCQRVLIPKGKFQVRCKVRAHTEEEIAVSPKAERVPVHLLPQETLEYLHPSRYCPCDMMLEEAEAIAGKRKAGYAQVAAIEQWIRDRMRYTPGASDEHTDALQSFQQEKGVCRDYAHIGIALTRALEIPARMVVGYLHGLIPMDLHAWFEAYVGGRWYTFDGTQGMPRGNRIAIGFGRDAADVALTSNYGPLKITKMKVTVEKVKG